MGAQAVQIVMTSAPIVRNAREDEGPLLADILSEAFAEDPVFGWFVRNDSKRGEALTAVFRSNARRFLPHGACLTTEDQRGAALWLPPLPPLPPAQETPRSLVKRLKSLPKRAAVSGFFRLRRMSYVDALMKSKHPEAPHYYLSAIGVRNEAKGRGMGSALLRAMLERCDTEGIPAYLENSNERNLPLYLRHGFETIERVDLPWGGPSLWLMWRKPA